MRPRVPSRFPTQELVQLTQELIDADVAAHPEVAEAVAAVAAEGTKIVTAGGHHRLDGRALISRFLRRAWPVALPLNAVKAIHAL